MVQYYKNPSINKSQENFFVLYSWLVDSESESYFSCTGMWLWYICVNVMFNVQVRLEQRSVIKNKDLCINLIFTSIKTIIIGKLMHYTGHTSSVRPSLIVSDDDIREFFWGVSSIFIPDQIVIESFVDFPKMARVRCRLITTNSIFLLSDWDQDQNRIKIIVYWSKAMLSHFHPSLDRRRRIQLERVIKYFWKMYDKTGHEN